ncbi:uncharacterized protein Bfra_001441 [Botrytis fragariae]|uniref:Uncharacterized protein n=1 Tax=Botrytis fragariae TaxID=1964551 RepID=A0A8H6EM97_9HELO|nr:uncharacterized protein Bfra_001441 [Botrytis fragariae]KAF5877080.1 hypothetical protein Bfra_001441 [Botrytis fragariae]
MVQVTTRSTVCRRGKENGSRDKISKESNEAKYKTNGFRARGQWKGSRKSATRQPMNEFLFIQ